MGNNKGGNKALYKKKNRGLLLKLLLTGQCTSRIALSKAMGMTKMSITNMVNELMERDILIESKKTANKDLGRNPIELKLSAKAPKVIGLLIFRNRCEAVLCDLQLRIIKRSVIEYQNLTKDQLLQYMYQVVDSVIDSTTSIVGIGVSSIGPIDIKSGKMLAPETFYGITDVPVVGLLKERYHLPIYFNNDNQNGVLAEKRFGISRHIQDTLLIGIGTGVGCGIIANDRLFENQEQMIPEFGHVSIDYRGRDCLCGNKGCIETYINTQILKEEMARATGLDLSFVEFCHLNSEDVHLILSDAMDKLSAALISLVNVMNTRLIILGHEGVHLDNRYLEELEEKINSRLFSRDVTGITVKKPAFMADAQLLGGACGIIEEVFLGMHLFDTD